MPLLLALSFHFAVAAGAAQDRKWRAEGATHSVWWAGRGWLWGPESTPWWHPHWNGISFHWAKLSLCTKLPGSIFDLETLNDLIFHLNGFSSLMNGRINLFECDLGCVGFIPMSIGNCAHLFLALMSRQESSDITYITSHIHMAL